MNRNLWFAVCLLLALGLLAWGLLVPAHLRAVEPAVLQRAGSNSWGLVPHGIELTREQRLGAARLILQCAPARETDVEKLRVAVNTLAARQPALVVSGGDASPRMERLFASDPHPAKNGFESLAEFVIRLENREVVLGLLRSSANPNVQELLRCRALTNTVIFSPSASASGQAFDAAVSIAGLLIEENRLAPRLRDALATVAASANHGADTQPLEQSLLDLLSLGQRFNWGQLAAFTAHIEDPDTLRSLAEQARNPDRLPALFAAVEMSGQPAAVAQYLMKFSQIGANDLASSLRYGPRGVKELLRRDQRLTYTLPLARTLSGSPVIHPFYQFALNCASYTPGLALALKWLAYLAAGFLLAAAFQFARPEVTELEQPLQVRGFHVVREILFALGFLLVVLLLSEPFLAPESQQAALPLRLHLPQLGSLIPAGNARNHSTIMNQNMLILLLFFVLQGLLYLFSCVKLAEIRRQNAPPRVKLKLLENEEHLFDAGLYLGFVGTIISFIVHSMMQSAELSLLGAYSSTSFGIIFVFVFKIFQLRPARRQMLLEAETESVPVKTAAAPALAPLP